MSLKFNVTLDRDEAGAWVVECPAIPGCVSQGASREEALHLLATAGCGIYSVLFLRASLRFWEQRGW